MIRIDGASKDYPGRPGALAELDLRVADGELVVIEGPAGAGKTTLCRLLVGSEPPSRGQVRIGDQEVARLPRQALAYLRRRIGLVFEADRFVDTASVLENVLLPLDIAGHPRREAIRRGRAALDRLGLLAREAARPGELSACERRRLGIARAIAHQPALLIADAPFAALAPTHRAGVAQLFADFAAAGCTVLLTARAAPAALYPSVSPAARIARLAAGRLLR